MAATAAASDGASSIQVAVRVRPFTIQEAAQLTKTDDGPLFLGDGSLAAAPKPKLGQKGIRPVIKVLDEKTLIFDPPEDVPAQRLNRTFMPTGKRSKDQTFAFDRVFDENTTQFDVYEGTARGLLDNVLDGYNATVFAYGATGCGKTHTITGTAQQPGIIFMTMQELFEKVDDLKETKESEITLSYLEIYNETIRDLLRPDEDTPKGGLMLREDKQQAVSVAGLSSHKPTCVQEVMDMVIRGNAARTQSPTEANATSSRSHAVLQVNVALKDRNASVHEPVTFATLSIIDLAGSERASATKNRGARLTEGANINKSLLALGSCINALCEMKRIMHIPYRNSKLTRLLKFSLGGNCKTIMVVCISPSSQHFDETQNTLRYANRAKNIQTKSVRNVYNVDRHVKDYLKKIDEQRDLINELTAQLKEHRDETAKQLRKSDAKRTEIAHDGIKRIRAAYEHSKQERHDRLSSMLRLKQLERRIGAISGWIGAFDQVCETREDEEPPSALVAMRKTAHGILLELEETRQHYHQKLAKINWTRAIDTALQDGVRQLQGLDGAAPDNLEEASLHKEVELLKSNADVEMYTAAVEQEKSGESGLIQVQLTAHFETIAILSQIMQMSDEEAIQAARGVLGKLLQSCTEATGQVIKPDGGLQITEAVPPTKSGTPRKKKQISLLGPSPMKSKIRQSFSQPTPVSSAPSAIPAHIAAEMLSPPGVGSSPARGAKSSPKRRVKLGGTARKGVAFGSGTPKKRSPVKKRSVRWKDEDADEGPLVEYQPTPKAAKSTHSEWTDSSGETNPLPDLSSQFQALQVDENANSSPLMAAPTINDTRKTGTGRFATGFLSKKNESSPSMPPPPALSLGSFSSDDDDSSPLRVMKTNAAPHPDTTNNNDPYSSNSSDAERSFSDRERAQQIRTAMNRNKRSSLGRRTSLGSNTAARLRERETTHRRRSPTATSPPSESTTFSQSHARRFVPGHRAEASRDSIISPRSEGVSKGGPPLLSTRRSMFDLGARASTPRESFAHGQSRPSSRVSTMGVVPGSARSANGGKGPWR